MTITIDLTPEQEARLRRRAAEQGKDAAKILTEFVATLPADESDSSSMPTPALSASEIAPTDDGVKLVSKQELFGVCGSIF